MGDFEGRDPTRTQYYTDKAYFWARARYTDDYAIVGLDTLTVTRILGALVEEVIELRERVEELESNQAETPTSDLPRQ